jgi:hypothetical protein
MSPMTNKIAAAGYAAAAVLFALAAYTAADAFFPNASGSGPNELLADIRPNASLAAEPAKLEDYAAITSERFMSFVPTPPASPGAGQPRPGGAGAAYVLRGVVFHSNPALSRAFIEIPGVEEERAYKIGDTVHGMSIDAIGERSVRIARNDQVYTLELRFDDSGSAPPPAPRPPDEGDRRERRERPPAGPETRGERREWPQNAAPGAAPRPAQDAAQGRPEALQNLPPRLRERFQALEPQERERLMRMSPEERAEFFRGRFRPMRDQERGPKQR